MLQKLNDIQHLPQNWDSYQADAPSAEAVANVRSFINDNRFHDLPFYFLAPSVNGEIMIEFKNGKRAAELYFLPDGTNEFFLFEDDEDVLESNLNEGFRILIHFLNP